jgi:hypothetical protein
MHYHRSLAASPAPSRSGAMVKEAPPSGYGAIGGANPTYRAADESGSAGETFLDFFSRLGMKGEEDTLRLDLAKYLLVVGRLHASACLCARSVPACQCTGVTVRTRGILLHSSHTSSWPVHG